MTFITLEGVNSWSSKRIVDPAKILTAIVAGSFSSIELSKYSLIFMKICSVSACGCALLIRLQLTLLLKWRESKRGKIHLEHREKLQESNLTTQSHFTEQYLTLQLGLK